MLADSTKLFDAACDNVEQPNHMFVLELCMLELVVFRSALPSRISC